MTDFKKIHTRQKEFFNSGATLNIAWRREKLLELLAGMQAMEDELFAALKADLKKPDFEAFESEIGFIYSEIRLNLSKLKKWSAPRRKQTPLGLIFSSSKIVAAPLGAVLIISPWNYPLMTALAPMVGAIAAGNCVLIKPSEFSSASSAILKKLVNKIFPTEFVDVVEGGVEVSQALLELSWDHIFFTGSTAVGRVVAMAAAKNLTPLTLELGGKSPCIVNYDADLDAAAQRIIWGKFLNCGQTCVAPDYLLLHKSIAKEFIEKCRKALQQQYGNSTLESPDYARIINRKHYDRLLSYLVGTKVLIGGQFQADELFIAPTLLTGIDLNHPIMKEEIFGPLLPVLEFENYEDIRSTIEKNSHPLALYLFTKDLSLEKRITEEIQFGGGCINNTLLHLGNSSLPFGGVGSSGYGAYHGERGFLQFSHQKSILRSATWFRPPILFPPYREKLRLLRGLMRWAF